MSIGIKFPWRISSNGGLETNSSTIDAIKDNLRVLLLTNFKERVMMPDFGADLHSHLFDQEDDVAVFIEENIKNAISRWIPSLLLKKITVKTSADKSPNLKSNQILVKLSFVYNGI